LQREKEITERNVKPCFYKIMLVSLIENRKEIGKVSPKIRSNLYE